MRIRMLGIGMGALALLAWLPAGAARAAGPFDGSKPVICSTDDTVACLDEGGCSAGDAADVNLPSLVRVDFAKKLITGLSGERAGETTPLETMRHNEGHLVVQGGQGGRGFTLLLDESTGDLTVGVVGSGTVFVVYGACAVL